MLRSDPAFANAVGRRAQQYSIIKGKGVQGGTPNFVPRRRMTGAG